MKRREDIKEEKREARREKIKDRWREFKENRRLAKEGKTHLRRADHQARYRQVDKILGRIIFILCLLNLIVWLIIFFV